MTNIIVSGLLYFCKLTEGVFFMLLGSIGIASFTWICVVLFGYTGYWRPLRYETVDMNAKVKTWSDVDVSDKQKNSDYTGPRLETPVKLPFTEPLFGSLLKDEKDLPLLHVLVSSSCVLYPMAIMVYALFMHSDFYFACFFGFVVYTFVRTQFFTDSMLHYRHYSSHRPMFKINELNYVSSIFLDPLMGIPPLVFLLHHPIMHHIANNGFYDITTTEPYQRDSWFAFANYWFRFQILAYVELPLYAWKSGRHSWFIASTTVIVIFFYLLQHLSIAYSGLATFCVFGIPGCLDHADDGKRNWCQHLFVVQYDSRAPVDTFWDLNCGMCYNLVDSLENRQQFNEGYHVVHHAYGGRHWSSIPDTFYDHVEKMSTYEKDLMCITFIDSHIWEVWVHAASNKLPQLVKNKYVHIPTAARPDPPTIEEVVIELKARLMPLDFKKRKAPEPQTQKRKRWQRQATQSKSVLGTHVQAAMDAMKTVVAAELDQRDERSTPTPKTIPQASPRDPPGLLNRKGKSVLGSHVQESINAMKNLIMLDDDDCYIKEAKIIEVPLYRKASRKGSTGIESLKLSHRNIADDDVSMTKEIKKEE